METYKVVAIEPGKPVRDVDMSLKDLHDFVGEVIQEIPLFDDIHAVFNGNAKELELDINRQFVLESKGYIPITLRGNVVLVRSEKGEFISLTKLDLEKIYTMFKDPSGKDTIYL